jgi:hypothetical protein
MIGKYSLSKECNIEKVLKLAGFQQNVSDGMSKLQLLKDSSCADAA